jgi:hypothetical protein
MNKSNNKLADTVSAIKELVGLFKTERMVYLFITLFSVVVLIGTAIYLIYESDNQENTVAIMGLFTSSGGIIYSSGRLLKMWSEAMKLIQKVIENND